MLKKHATTIIVATLLVLLAGVAGVFLWTSDTNEQWRAVQSNVMLQLMPATHKDQIDVVWKPFIDDVDIGVVVDADKQYQFVERDKLELWKINEDALFEQALRNLDAISRNIKVEVAQATENDPTSKYVIVELDDGYTAARIISEGVRQAIARELGSQYIAAIPTRDFLIFWHKDFALFDAFANQVEAEYRAETEYPLTPIILFVDDTGVQEMIKKDDR